MVRHAVAVSSQLFIINEPVVDLQFLYYVRQAVDASKEYKQLRMSNVQI